MKKQSIKRADNRNKNKAVCDEILRSGGDILSSETFRKTCEETHHLHGTVADHTLSVCIISARICRALQKKGIRVDSEDLIRASLCHDLGMLGRDKTYQSRFKAWKEHPEVSVRLARKLFANINDRTDMMIRSHMWPFAGSLPRTREALILRSADRLASMTDWFAYLTGKEYGKEIKEKLIDSSDIFDDE